MDKLGFGDVVDVPTPTIGDGPPEGKGVVVGYLVTHPDSKEVWIAWADEDEPLKPTTEHKLGPKTIRHTLETARKKYYKAMAAAGDFLGDIIKMMTDD